MIRSIILSPLVKPRAQLVRFAYSPYIKRRYESTNSDATSSNSNNNSTYNVSNITKILNELNDEDDFDSPRSVRYRTTASQLVEAMGKNNQDAMHENEKELEKLDTSLPVVQDKAEEDPSSSTSSNKEKKQVIIERYLHTHELYKQLRDAQFTERQANLLLDLILSQLQKNVNSMVSKHSPMLDLENEHYLFQAAQQELKSEVSSSKDSDLNLLINSSILLKRSFQSLEDELVTNYKLMDNSIKLELNQFKHENNLHHKALDLKNQDLNNKIITDLVGELRSHTESLRWQLTRSALATIFIMAFLAISTYTFIKSSDDDDDDILEEPAALMAAAKLKQEELGSKAIIAKMTTDKEVDDEQAEASLDERL